MNEDRYRYFIEICQCGGITKAAENLYISQPALSKYISRLESELDTQLFDRENAPFKLTETGKIYFEYSKDMFNRYQRMKSNIDELNESLVKTISFGIASNLSQYYLNDIIKIALDINSTFDFNVVEDTSLNMEKYVESGEVGIAFLNTDNICNKKIDFTVVKEDYIYLVCRKDNPALINRRTTVINGVETYLFSRNEIGNLQFYSRDRNFKLTQTVDKYISKKGIDIKNNMCVSDIYTMLYLVKDTNRFAFFPQFFLEESGFIGDISLCSIDGEQIKWYMVLARLKSSNFSKPIMNWIDQVRDFYVNNK